MAQTYTGFRDDVEALVQDSSNVNFTTAELDTFIKSACRESSRYVPHVLKFSFNIESRTGEATSTSADNLVDTTASQFTSTDVGKVVFNTYDKTWAVITSYSSATSVGLSKDIMSANEGYEIYNSGCTQNNQVNISAIDDYLDIERVEYPIGTPRNWELNGDILTIKVDYIPDSKVLTTQQNDTEVMVWFKKRHLISQLTDLAGAVANTAGYSAGATTIALSSLQASGTIETGQEFTVPNVRGTYMVTSNTTIASNTATIIFYPGLESTVANTTAVNFKLSTLPPKLEPIVQELAAGLAVTSKPMSAYQQGLAATASIGLSATAIATVSALVNAATADASSARTALTAGITSILAMTTQISAATAFITSGTAYIASTAAGTSSAVVSATGAFAAATTAISFIDEQVALASSAMTSGLALVNTIPIGGGAGEYAGQANADLSVAQGDLMNGQGWLQAAAAELNIASNYYNAANMEVRASSEWAQQANTYHANASQYLNSAATDLRMASERISESNANLQKAATQIRVADSGRNIEAWGRNTLNEARTKLRLMMPTKYMTSKTYARD